MIDLHLHLDGSLPLNAVETLAKRQGIALPCADASQLAGVLSVGADCDSLNTYLRCFDFPLTLLQSAWAVEYAVRAVRAVLAEQGLCYAELRFAPALHTRAGCTQRQIIEAALAGIRGDGVACNLILCCMRGGDPAENLQTVELAAAYLGQGVVAVDLAGAEALYPTTLYADAFARARALGLPFTIHAGEAAGADSICTALDFGAARIGHGIAAIHDAALMQRLAREKIPLELCPSSNLQTKAVDALDSYPLADFLQAGICATVNTDNMTVSGTTLQREYARLQLTAAQKRQLLENSIAAAFLPSDAKEKLRALIFEK